MENEKLGLGYNGCNDVTQRLKVVPSYIITSYLTGDYFQVLCNIIVRAAPMERQQSSLIITPEWEYGSLPYRPIENLNFSFSVSLSTRCTEESSLKYEKYLNSLVIFERNANGLIRFNYLC